MPERGKGKAELWPLLILPKRPFTRRHSSLQFVYDQLAIRGKRGRMNRRDAEPEVSVIIPTLREAPLLVPLIDMLARQRDVALEVILSDGCSRDGSIELAQRAADAVAAPVIIVTGEPGRGGQLNRGAAEGRGEFLLFMHADSCLPDPRSLRLSLDHLRMTAVDRGGPVAGKFRLCFVRSGADHPFGYYYHESKTRLLRRECTHGDQGLLVPRPLFSRLGPFDESCSMLAETRMADAILDEGRLCLLPSEIHTSARRFEAEGLPERQTLNAIIMNFAALDWQLFFREIPSLYPRQDQASPLPLRQLLRRIGALIGTLPLRERLSLWYRTGGYVRSNAWQLAFACDSLRNFRRGMPPGAGETPFLSIYDRHIEALTTNKGASLLTSLLVRCWFFLKASR